MVSMLPSSAVDDGVDPFSSQTKDYEIGIFGFTSWAQNIKE